jgi:DNA-binding transcriptional LysR family regulator
VYGARSYLRGKNVRRSLSEHDWIALDDSFGQHDALKWLARHLPPEQARVRMNSYPGILHACASGLGLAVLPCFLGDREARLKRVTGTLADCRRPLWLLHHPDLRNMTRVRVVCNVVQDVMHRHLGELEGKTSKAAR